MNHVQLHLRWLNLIDIVLAIGSVAARAADFKSLSAVLPPRLYMILSRAPVTPDDLDGRQILAISRRLPTSGKPSLRSRAASIAVAVLVLGVQPARTQEVNISVPVVNLPRFEEQVIIPTLTRPPRLSAFYLSEPSFKARIEVRYSERAWNSDFAGDDITCGAHAQVKPWIGTKPPLSAFYPEPLRTQGIGGEARIWIYTSRDGTIQRVRIGQSTGHPALDAAAEALLRSLEYVPVAGCLADPPGIWTDFRVRFVPAVTR